MLFSTTTILEWNGASDATITGMIGTGPGRFLVIENISNNKTLTLPNLTGSTGQNQFLNFGNADVTLSPSPTLSGSSAVYFWDSTSAHWHQVAGGSAINNLAMSFTSSKNKGTITLSTGTGTATVLAGAICACTDTSGTPTLVGCSVSGTTLTANGTGTDVVSYICL